jgi:predicted restriction endonuclease
MRHVSALDRRVFAHYANNWDELATRVDAPDDEEPAAHEDEPEWAEVGQLSEREAVVRVRLLQRFFRKAVMAAYDSTCCVCGLADERLLIASHIIPWRMAYEHRANPRNGLALCAIHDRAFDAGLMTVTPEFTVRLSPQLTDRSPVARTAFHELGGSKITQPSRFAPLPDFLAYHRDTVFRS